MFLVYRPDGQDDEQRWEYVPGRMKSAEREACERRTGMTWEEFKVKVVQGSAVARRVLLWTFLRRQHHTLKFEDVDYCDDELQLLRTRDEIERELDELAKFEGLSDLERQLAEQQLRAALVDAPDAPGKAPTTSSSAATG
ncbi:hypothetical protein ACN27G_05985 [Plantactinospora sp. WMMB334]|uniref:hypothetical protein n=1 Tax=Plantactinospora sp. WMMB334 TaxID=3404119 RepID=UPI003B958C2A